jgi:O-antigen biosynthesis protein
MSDDSRPVAVRLVEWTEPLAPLLTVEPYWGVRVVVMRKGIPVGSIDLPNRFRTVGEAQLKEAIVKGVEARLLEHGPSEVDEPLPPGVSVSIVVPTYDRPESLRKCLRSLQDLESPREIQIIVVDNHPESGLTAPVAAEFSRVMLARVPLMPGMRESRAAVERSSRSRTTILSCPRIGWRTSLLRSGAAT